MEIEYGVLGEFPYCIRQHDTLGHLCGYLGVPAWHPWYGRWYDNLTDVSVHGGLTFAQHEERGHPTTMAVLLRLEEGFPLWRHQREYEAEHQGERTYPHVTGLDVWWVGFDCAHAGDEIPKGLARREGVYRDRDYVYRELTKLAAQAATAARKEHHAE